ncbi:MAG: hypothetical protein KIS81_08200 [Maricaulaceae bacterium]|nr:hypothetical protein [Maricaulaceae bacterium]
MPREVDERKTRRALRKLERIRARAARGEALSDWEAEFLASVEQRLNAYGSAFNDPEKGALSEPLSARQGVKMREIGKKTDGKGKPLKRSSGLQAKPGKGLKRGGGFKRKPPARTGRSRDINEDAIAPAPEPPPPEPAPAEDSKPARPALRVIDGGKKDGE